jgi:hypothetical protein
MRHKPVPWNDYSVVHEVKRAIHHETCIETCLDTSISRNMSQRVWRCLKELVSVSACLEAGGSITALTVYHDTLQLRLRQVSGLETTSNSLAASLLWITTKWILIVRFWRNCINIYRLHSETVSKCVSAWYHDTSLMKPRYRNRSRDKSHSVWPA